MKNHLDSKQERGKFVAVSCLAVHVHIDWDQEEQAFQITLQEQDTDDENLQRFQTLIIAVCK